LRRVKLEKHIKLVGGGTPSKKKPEYWNGDIPWASVKDFKSKNLADTVDKITKEGLENSSSKLVEKGNLIIATRMAVGKAVMTEIDVAINQDLKAVYTSGDLDTKYLQYFFDSQTDYFERTGKGATVKGIKIGDIQNLEIPLPSLSEQKAIVAKLDRAQRLIDIDREMLAKYDELIQSVFLEMFGDPVRNEKGWEVKPLKKLGDIQTGKTPSTKNDDFFKGDIPFVTPSDLGENSIYPTRFLSNDGLDNSRKVRKGTTLVCCIGATIGKVGMTKKISGFNQQINSIEWNNYFVLDEVGYQGMRFYKNEITKNAKSTTLPILKKSLFENLVFPVFDRDLQEKFAQIYYQVSTEKEEISKSQKKSEELFSSLVQGVFG